MKSVDNNERIGRLETSVEGLHTEFNDIRSTLRAIQDSVNRSKETNWSVIFAGVAVAGSLYAAAIRPLEKDLLNQKDVAADIARAVLVKDDKINNLTSEFSRIATLVEHSKNDIESVLSKGSPVSERRISLLEQRLGADLKKP